jgi:HEAT repeat protein
LLSHELDEREVDPKMTQYVALTLGAFQTLEAKTQSGQPIDPLVPLARALAPKYPTPVRIAAAASLAKQAARLGGKLDDPAGIAALGEAAAIGEPEVRQMAVYALGFFGGQAAARILRERVQQDEDRFVRYNAATALARRGDLAATGTMREMLSTSDLNKLIDLPGATEKQNKIESIELEALAALHSSVSSEGSPQLASSLRPQLEDLTKSGLVSVRTEALEVLQNLQKVP